MAKLSDYDIETEAMRLRDNMNRVLETVVSVFESYNVPLPSRRYWTFGIPAVDCEQVVVSFVQTYLGRPGDQASEPRNCNEPRSFVVSISISRKQTLNKNGNPPTAEQIIADGEWQAVDTWTLMEAIQQFDTWNGYGRGLGVIATTMAEQPQGGYYTTTMQLTLGVS